MSRLTNPLCHLPLQVPRNAMTLIEMLVAMAVTLIMMAAVAQLFGSLGRGVGGSRSLVELDDRMRAVAFRMRTDLEGVTAPVHERPPLQPERNLGYFEYIEGPMDDRSAFDAYVEGAPDDRLRGDVDDILMFTTRAAGAGFSGRSEGIPIHSLNAEVIWYCRPTPGTSEPALYTLYRRQRLIMAHPGVPPFITPSAPNAVPFTTWSVIHALTDVSCRLESGYAVPNTLGDLTKRENRFCRDDFFPYRFLRDKVDSDGSPILTFGPAHPRYGDDVVLTNVIAFDVRAVDVAPLKAVGTLSLSPGDMGYRAVPGTISPFSIPVDLGWAASPSLGWADCPPLLSVGQSFPPPFTLVNPPVATVIDDSGNGLWSRGVAVRNSLPNQNPENLLENATYCTWSTHYEYNGIDDDGLFGVDQGVDGVDNNMNNLIDEPAEAETSPPYPVPLNGVEVRIRCYEPSSRQVRQVTVRHTFVPN
jgi:prepilin-type N-terminal cleavage/methylation domain-containing protein